MKNARKTFSLIIGGIVSLFAIMTLLFAVLLHFLHMEDMYLDNESYFDL